VRWPEATAWRAGAVRGGSAGSGAVRGGSAGSGAKAAGRLRGGSTEPTRTARRRTKASRSAGTGWRPEAASAGRRTCGDGTPRRRSEATRRWTKATGRSAAGRWTKATGRSAAGRWTKATGRRRVTARAHPGRIGNDGAAKRVDLIGWRGGREATSGRTKRAGRGGRGRRGYGLRLRCANAGRSDTEHRALQLWTRSGDGCGSGDTGRGSGRRSRNAGHGAGRAAGTRPWDRRVDHQHGPLEFRGRRALQVEPALLAGRRSGLVLSPTIRAKHSSPRSVVRKKSRR
jgi:hypothetical protein